MIKTHQKFKLPDENKGNHVIVEVNWNDDPKVKDCQMIKIGDAVVKKEHLMAILFTIGNGEEQMKMVPYRVQHNRHYETMVGVTATKDIRKGEKINFPIKLTLPTYEEEIWGDDRKKSPIIRPR